MALAAAATAAAAAAAHCYPANRRRRSKRSYDVLFITVRDRRGDGRLVSGMKPTIRGQEAGPRAVPQLLYNRAAVEGFREYRSK